MWQGAARVGYAINGDAMRVNQVKNWGMGACGWCSGWCAVTAGVYVVGRGKTEASALWVCSSVFRELHDAHLRGLGLGDASG